MKRSSLILPLAVATTALFSVSTAKAAEITWSGGGSTNSWTDAENWIGGGVPVAGDIVVMTGTADNAPDFATTTILGGIKMTGSGTTMVGVSGASGYTIHLGGDIVRSSTGYGVVGGTVELHDDITLDVQSSSRYVNFNGGTASVPAITGAYGITKTGAGYSTFFGTSTFSGGLTVNGGAVYSRNGNENTTHFGTGVLTVISGTVGMSVTSTTVKGLAGTGGIIMNTSGAEKKFTVDTTLTTNSYAGVIQDGSAKTALTKAGTGSLTLSGANTYTAATTVNGGLLKIVGSLGATAVTVNNGGALGGAAGTIAGAVTVKDGGALSFTLADDGVKGLDLGSTLTLESGADLKLTLTGTVVDEYTLLSTTGTLSGKFASVNGIAVGGDDSFILNRGGTDYNFQLLYGTNDLKVAYQAIPEASTYAMVGVGAAALFFFGARRRKEQA